jgi:hypothetical protein
MWFYKEGKQISDKMQKEMMKRLLDEAHYDLIVNIGQIVPHEVLGFANHNKNYFIFI